jgi:L-seryl-tRNA(Ser) seleniumtransferase
MDREPSMTGDPSLRQLPAVDRLLHEPEAGPLIAVYGHESVRDALRGVLDVARQWLREGGTLPPYGELLHAAESMLRAQFLPTLRPVINATGVIIHTNLGRAPLSESAQSAILSAASGYTTLEYDLESGERGRRDDHPETLLKLITGAEAALVVNNNAAAVSLLLTALARDKEVIVSRGQLVEIGGGFRMPDVMARSGARLVEVGTTNKTHLDDFDGAIGAQTALLLRVHASNFKLIGFTAQPPLPELAALARKRGVLAVDDLGSGALLDTAQYGLAHEPTVQESLAAGVDLVAFSGDKLLGGPQAGIIVGKADLVAALKKHPLTRTVRADKLCLAGLIATLEHYRKGDAPANIPVWQMIGMSLDTIAARAESWAARVGGNVINGQSAVGGGSLPGETLPTALLALEPSDPVGFASRLRRADTPVIARIAEERVLLDPRTVLPGQDDALIETLLAAQGEK